MSSLEKSNEPRFYDFSWELVGYDSGPSKIRSQIFKNSFEVTEWYMELDLSKLQNVDSCIPFRLQRIPGIGPCAVTFDVKITVKLSENKDFKLEKSQTARVFSEKGINFWAFDIDVPSQKLESKEDDINWLTSKNMLINVEMKSSEKTDLEFPKNYWLEESSVRAVMKDLKTLYSNEYFHDLVLKVAGKEFKLHKCILNARWPKFMSTLEIGKISAEVETKEFSGIPHALLEHILRFAYYGDLNFMYELDEIVDGDEVFDFAEKYNLYRLIDQISQLSPKCSSSQIFQCYRTSIGMKFTNVLSTVTPMGDFKTCEIPLKPRKLPKSDKPLTEKEREKFQKHIRFMDLKLYVNKGPLGYNWLMFSIVLGKIPRENPVTIGCKLYVVGEGNVNYLLTEQNLVFDKNTEISFTTAFSQGKLSKRYCITSEPIITWEELIDERNNFMRKRLVKNPLSKKLELIGERKASMRKKPVTDPSSEKPEPIGERITSMRKKPVTDPSSDKPELIDEEKDIGPKEQVIDPSSDKVIEEKDIYFRFELKLADGEYLHETRHGEHIFMYEGDYKIFQDLELMLNDDKFTDVTVTSGERSIKAHKAILVARSPKIAKALLGKQTKFLEINIQPEYLQSFIHYLYTGQIQEVPDDKIDHLLYVAKEYGMDCLKDVLARHKHKMNGIVIA